MIWRVLMDLTEGIRPGVARGRTGEKMLPCHGETRIVHGFFTARFVLPSFSNFKYVNAFLEYEIAFVPLVTRLNQHPILLPFATTPHLIFCSALIDSSTLSLPLNLPLNLRMAPRKFTESNDTKNNTTTTITSQPTIGSPTTKMSRNNNARRSSSAIEEHYRVEGETTKERVVLPGVPKHEADWARDAHDFFNLVVLVRCLGGQL
jgi:hypothetical protein